MDEAGHSKIIPQLVRQMVDNAVNWARTRGLVRVSPVHGEEVFKIPSKWTFKHNDMNQISQTASGSTQLEASCFLRRKDCPF